MSGSEGIDLDLGFVYAAVVDSALRLYRAKGLFRPLDRSLCLSLVESST
jgi:hypothetical protein